MDPNAPYNPNNPNVPNAGGRPGFNGGVPLNVPQAGGPSYQPDTQNYGGPNLGGLPPQQPFQPNPYSGYNPNPYPGEADYAPQKSRPRRGGPKKPLLILGVIGLVLIGAVVGILLISNQPATTNNKAVTPTTTTTTQNPADDAGADVVPRNDGQLDLSERIDTSKSIKEQTIKAKIKGQVNLSSGFSFMVNKVEPYTSANPATKPAAGKQFIVLSVVVGDRSQSSGISVSYLDFKLRDNDNNILPGHSSTQEIIGNPLANPTALKPGDQVAGKIVFEVDDTDTDWVLIHKETYQKTTDNTTFTVEGDIVVTLTPAASPSPSPGATPTTPPTPSST